MWLNGNGLGDGGVLEVFGCLVWQAHICQLYGQWSFLLIEDSGGGFAVHGAGKD